MTYLNIAEAHFNSYSHNTLYTGKHQRAATMGGRRSKKRGPPKVDYIKKYSQFNFNKNTKAIE